VKLILAAAMSLSACATTYVPGPDPIPVIGGQIAGASGSWSTFKTGAPQTEPRSSSSIVTAARMSGGSLVEARYPRALAVAST
jgi:hypothetical protein